MNYVKKILNQDNAGLGFKPPILPFFLLSSTGKDVFIPDDFLF